MSTMDRDLILKRYADEKNGGMLVLYGNNISDISCLSSCDLSTFERLNLSGNNISDISVLSSCDLSNLRELYLQENNLSDIECLYECNFMNLKTLELYGNNIVNYRTKRYNILIKQMNRSNRIYRLFRSRLEYYAFLKLSDRGHYCQILY